MLKFLISAIAVCVSSMALASGNRLDELHAAHPNETPYQILRDLFNESTVAASLSDFDLAKTDRESDGRLPDPDSNQKCALASAEADVPTQWYFQRYVVTMNSDLGPLFPADRRSVIIVRGNTNLDDDSLASADSQSTRYSISTTARDLTEIITSEYLDDAPLRMTARENGNLIAIRIIAHVGQQNAYEEYAYCFRSP